MARKIIYASSESNFALFNSDNADLYYTFKQNIVGGPSIIFTRYQEKGVTKIKTLQNNVRVWWVMTVMDCIPMLSSS